MKTIATILLLSAMAWGWQNDYVQEGDYIYGGESVPVHGEVMTLTPTTYDRCIAIVNGFHACVPNKGSNTPVHLMYFQNGSIAIYDEEGYVWPFSHFTKVSIEEFTYGVH